MRRLRQDIPLKMDDAHHGILRLALREASADPSGRSAEILEFEVCDQYTIQGDLPVRARPPRLSTLTAT